jgi:hypothetical protein
MWKYKYVYHSPSQYWILIVIGIKRTPNPGKASGHTSQREHKNDIHTHTHTYLYILLGLRKKKNYVTLRYILVTSSLLPSLSYNQIIFCLHLDHQIPQYGHLLKSLTLEGWYSASQDGGMNFQTKHYKYFLYSITFHWGIFFT